MEERCKGTNIKESSTIDKEKVKLKREWSIWENYDTKNKNEKDYSKLLKEIYSFDNIIAFWQFWNKYPGNDAKNIYFYNDCLTFFFEEKFRIIAMNLFEKGIKPEWEDKRNKNVTIFSLEYVVKEDLDEFYKLANITWIKLICSLIGEELPFCEYINGIRFVDKTRFGKDVLFRFEVWANDSISKEECDELNEYLKKTYGCKSANYKKIANS